MSNQSNYPCPICGADSLSTDFTDGFKWGRAYCNSCDCGGPEVRTGYEESLDAPWREEARKQFVEVVNEHIAKRSPWVKTADRAPTMEDADAWDLVFATHRAFGGEPYKVRYRVVANNPSDHVWWMPIPPLPEVVE